MREIKTANSYLSFILLYILAKIGSKGDPEATRPCNTLHKKKKQDNFTESKKSCLKWCLRFPFHHPLFVNNLVDKNADCFF